VVDALAPLIWDSRDSFLKEPIEELPIILKRKEAAKEGRCYKRYTNVQAEKEENSTSKSIFILSIEVTG
jgi:hypothetical protein